VSNAAGKPADRLHLLGLDELLAEAPSFRLRCFLLLEQRCKPSRRQNEENQDQAEAAGGDGPQGGDGPAADGEISEDAFSIQGARHFRKRKGSKKGYNDCQQDVPAHVPSRGSFCSESVGQKYQIISTQQKVLLPFMPVRNYP
jgi:hypothetical protein